MVGHRTSEPVSSVAGTARRERKRRRPHQQVPGAYPFLGQRHQTVQSTARRWIGSCTRGGIASDFAAVLVVKGSQITLVDSYSNRKDALEAVGLPE